MMTVGIDVVDEMGKDVSTAFKLALSSEMHPSPGFIPTNRILSVFCDRCGCSVDTDLIHPEGHHYAADGDFYCADCWAG
jgi:hypothetical protein